MVIWRKVGREAFRSLPTIALTVCIALLLAYELWRSYTAAREDTERSVYNLVHVMSEQIARTIQSIDVNLQDIAGELAKSPALLENDTTFRAGLHKRLATLPYVRALFVIRRDGYISHDTDFPSTPRVRLADREYFKAHREDASLGLHISHPLKSRSLGVWFISLSRRVETADGRFGGIAVAAVEPLYFEKFYRRLWLGGGTIALLLEDGTMLARSPANEEVMGASFAGVEPFPSLARGEDHGVFWITSPIDGVRRVVGYQLLDSVPLVMLVTLNEAEVMRPWRAHAMVGLIGATILLTLLLALEWLTRRSRRREEQARLHLERTRRLEAVGRFAGNIAHDLGNLMRIIRSAMVVLRPMVSEKREAVALLDEVDLSLASGRALINQLLSYARNAEIRLEAADLNLLVSDCLPLLRQAAGPRVEIATMLAPEAATCLLDKAQFQAAIVNLVLNARDAMPDGGRISIDIRLIEEADAIGPSRWVDLNISDEGIGMTDDIRHQAFDPFFTTKEPGAGTGIGLSQVMDFARQCSGRVEIFSRAGEGTTIRLRLPMEAAGAGASQQAETYLESPRFTEGRCRA